MASQHGGHGKKLRMRPEHNKRKRESFIKRYGMSSSTWSYLKTKLRLQGEGMKISNLFMMAQKKSHG